MEKQQREHDLWNLSENIRATSAVLSELSIRASSYAKDLGKAGVLLQLTKELLANINSLEKAAQVVPYISRPITKDVLAASVGLKRRVSQYKADIENYSEGNENNYDASRPKCIYNMSHNHLKKTAQDYCKTLSELRDKVQSESLMKAEEEKSAETGQRAGDSGNTYNIINSHVSLGNKAQHATGDINTNIPKSEKKWLTWVIILGVIATILTFLFGDEVWIRFIAEPKSNKPAVKQIETPNVPDNLVDANGVVFEARPTAEDIIEEIEKLPRLPAASSQ